MIGRLLEIEKRLDITIEMPQICHFCDEEIIDKFGDDTRSLIFHSLDGNHENWDLSNKVPAHRGCHVKWHNKYTTDYSRQYGKPNSGSGTTWQKKFQQVGGTTMIIVPKIWIKSEELRHDKKMRGVYVTLVRVDKNNDTLHITPMWEDEG